MTNDNTEEKELEDMNSEEKMDYLLNELHGNPIPINQRLTEVESSLNENERCIISVKKDVENIKNRLDIFTRDVGMKIWVILGVTVSVLALVIALIASFFVG